MNCFLQTYDTTKLQVYLFELKINLYNHFFYTEFRGVTIDSKINWLPKIHALYFSLAKIYFAIARHRQLVHLNEILQAQTH